jgi:hypothetical protein
MENVCLFFGGMVPVIGEQKKRHPVFPQHGQHFMASLSSSAIYEQHTVYIKNQGIHPVQIVPEPFMEGENRLCFQTHIISNAFLCIIYILYSYQAFLYTIPSALTNGLPGPGQFHF